MMLNEEGNLFHSKQQYYHVAPDHIHSGSFDIMTFEDQFLSAGINGPDANGTLSTTITSINPASSEKNLAYQGMTWPKYDIQQFKKIQAYEPMQYPDLEIHQQEEQKEEQKKEPQAPVVENLEIQKMFTEDLRELIELFGKINGKDFSEVQDMLYQQDINSVSELAALSDDEFDMLGFTVELKLTIRGFLQSRQAQ